MNHKFPVSVHDTLLQGLNLNDLITAVSSNEPEINEKTVTKTYETIVQEVLKAIEDRILNSVST